MVEKKCIDNKGMTLVEIMMALAVFGIIMLIFIGSVRSYSDISNYNTDYVRMAELARARLEMIKAGVPGSYLGDNVVQQFDYPLNSGLVEEYNIKFNKSDTGDYGKLIKLTVGTIDYADPDNDPGNYVLVGWLTSTINNGGGGGDTGAGEPIMNIPGGVWGIPADDWAKVPKPWRVITGENGTIIKPNGRGGHDYIFYKPTFSEYNYVAYIEIPKDQGNFKFAAGITFGSTASSLDNVFYLKDYDLYYNGQLKMANAVDPDVGDKYYLQANRKGDVVTLKCGYVDENNYVIPSDKEWSVTIADSAEYYLGLWDDTAGNYEITFSFPPVVGGVKP